MITFFYSNKRTNLQSMSTKRGKKAFRDQIIIYKEHVYINNTETRLRPILQQIEDLFIQKNNIKRKKANAAAAATNNFSTSVCLNQNKKYMKEFSKKMPSSQSSDLTFQGCLFFYFI